MIFSKLLVVGVLSFGVTCLADHNISDCRDTSNESGFQALVIIDTVAGITANAFLAGRKDVQDGVYTYSVSPHTNHSGRVMYYGDQFSILLCPTCSRVGPERLVQAEASFSVQGRK